MTVWRSQIPNSVTIHVEGDFKSSTRNKLEQELDDLRTTEAVLIDLQKVNRAQVDHSYLSKLANRFEKRFSQLSILSPNGSSS